MIGIILKTVALAVAICATVVGGLALPSEAVGVRKEVAPAARATSSNVAIGDVEQLVRRHHASARIDSKTARAKDLKSKKAVSAVIAESRNLTYLPMVLLNMHHWLPDIRIQLFHSKTNMYFVENQPDMQELRRQGVLTLAHLPGEFYDGSYNWTGYQRLMESTAFWNSTLPARKVLAFQADSWVCRGADELLRKFTELDYEYVGAPWGKKRRKCLGGVGNGGFSLRDRQAMLEVVQANPVPLQQKPLAEDLYFCSLTKSMPNKTMAARWAQEETFDGKPSAGFHKVWKFAKDLAEVERICPGIELLTNLLGSLDNTSDFTASKLAVAHWRREVARPIAFSSLLEVGAFEPSLFGVYSGQ